MIKTHTEFAGLKLANPLIIASSGLTDSLEKLIDLEKAGAAAVVLKSLFEEEVILDMQAKLSQISSDQFIYPETLSYYEDQYNVQEATGKYLTLIESAKSTLKIPVIASINCLTADQWTYFPKQIETAGADALELNMFILPSDIHRTAAENEHIYFDVVNEISQSISIPLIIKLSPYFSNLASFLKQLSETNISGLVLFNKFYNPDFDLDTLEITSGPVLSHPSDIYQSLRWIAIMNGKTSCDLAASTGIHDGNALIKQLLAGARAVEIASTIYQYGSKIIPEILSRLGEWMSAHGYSSIQEFNGKLSQKNIDNPAIFERIQFMKYFRNFTM